MSGDVTIPFNFDPVNNEETAASYTVPAGKYAIATIVMSVSAVGSTSGSPNSNTPPAVVSSSDSTSFELRLVEGKTLTKTESPANSSNNAGSGQVGNITVTGSSTAVLYVDGIEVGRLSCGGYASIQDNNAGSGISHTVSVNGIAKVNWHIAEYNSIT